MKVDTIALTSESLEILWSWSRNVQILLLRVTQRTLFFFGLFILNFYLIKPNQTIKSNFKYCKRLSLFRHLNLQFLLLIEQKVLLVYVRKRKSNTKKQKKGQRNGQDDKIKNRKKKKKKTSKKMKREKTRQTTRESIKMRE